MLPRRVAWLAGAGEGSRADQVIGFLPYRDRRVAYALSGAGPPLVLDTGRVHHLEVFWRYRPYRRLVQRLSRRFTVVRWDRPGFGLSDRHRWEPSPDAEQELLDALLTFLGAGQVAIVAAGDAGPAMVRYAARRPERVSRLALFGTAASGPLTMPAPDATLSALAAAVAPTIHLAAAAAQSAGSEPEDGSWLASAFAASASVTTMVELVTATRAEDVRADAARVRAPTLVLHRADDAALPADRGRALAAGIPGAEFVALDGRSHVLFAGDVGAVLAALVPFLSGSCDVPALSRREVEVARMVVLGLTNAEIASRLAIRRRTVESHLEHIRAKLAVSSRAQIVAGFARSQRAGAGRWRA